MSAGVRIPPGLKKCKGNIMVNIINELKLIISPSNLTMRDIYIDINKQRHDNEDLRKYELPLFGNIIILGSNTLLDYKLEEGWKVLYVK